MTIIDRARPVFAIFIILIIDVVFLKIIKYEILNYASFGDVIVYSKYSISLVLFPLVTIFALMYFVLSIIKGSEVATSITGKYIFMLKWLVAMVLILGLLGSFLYQKNLTDKGYLICRGIPSGWMPGMAIKYVKDKALCNVRG